MIVVCFASVMQQCDLTVRGAIENADHATPPFHSGSANKAVSAFYHSSALLTRHEPACLDCFPFQFILLSHGHRLDVIPAASS